MSDMFRNYPQPEGYTPNNRIRCHGRKPITLMAGETTTHTFDVPFDIKKDTTNLEIIYKLGLSPVLVKDETEVEIGDYDEEKHQSVLTCVISSEESKLFADTLLKASVQIKFIMTDGSTLYTEIYTIKLKDALDIGGDAPTPSIIVGIGYTED